MPEIKRTPLGGPNLTEWHNPTSRTVKFPIRRGPKQVRHDELGRPHIVHPGVDMVEIAAGESVLLPSMFDQAIQVVRDGVVFAGLAPQLVKNGNRVPMHPAIDPDESAKREAEAEAAAALADKDRAETALIVAEGKKAKATKAKAAKAAERGES